MRVGRRTILAAGVGAIAGMAISESAAASPADGFALDFAPHQGSFASRGTVLEQIAYAAEQGFRAWEDNEAARRSVAEQEAMARALSQHGMTMGVFVASMPRWKEFQPVLGGDDDSARDAFLTDIRAAVDVAKRLNARWTTVVPGFLDPRLPVDIQQARIIDVLRRAADIMAPHGIVMVMEPLNTRTNHPRVFLQTIAQGYALAVAVNDPSVKILADLYHEQIQSGNLIPTLDQCWDEIAYLQFGDNPGRKEPGTGEINYAIICKWLKEKGFAGVIGMEHGNSAGGRAGEDRLIAAYRAINPI
ncbi:hydroxypyruvate isomerase family protein [Sphingobium algorifonticola]|uniref:Xylose isomerase n=1 Tax=Sphingobium algorifonticola TaxID=2008318 RepID=A0A437J9V4_9SPHN|nr:TIM barrel protein [Sphingobium algorifonticola]RVT42296.1 xylose isomerase [Sphingobium algorifonticola]